MRIEPETTLKVSNVPSRTPRKHNDEVAKPTRHRHRYQTRFQTRLTILTPPDKHVRLSDRKVVNYTHVSKTLNKIQLGLTLCKYVRGVNA
jgi:hypothetical protein